jgi:hypothetical protein
MRLTRVTRSLYGAAIQPITNFVAVGDSQTVGGGGWADNTITDLAAAYGMTGSKIALGSRTLGVPGDTNAVNSQWGHIQEVKDALTAQSGRTIIAYFMGHNDLATYKSLGTGALRAAQYYTDTKAYIAALRATRSDFIFIWIIPTIATSAFANYVNLNAGVQAFRPYVRGGAGTDGFEAFADFGAHPDFVDDLATNVSADGLHIGASGGTSLRDVLRAVIDSFKTGQSGNTAPVFNLGADVTNASVSTPQHMNTMITGLGNLQSINSATATNGQVKQGHGAYAASIGAGQLFNGDVVRSEHMSSGSVSTTTTYGLTLQPGNRTDSCDFTTASVTSRATLTQWTPQGGLGIVLADSGQSVRNTTDGGGSQYIPTNQNIIAGRLNYFELTYVSGSSPQGIAVGLADPSVSMFVVPPGLSGYMPGATYLEGGLIAANSQYNDDNTGSHQPFTAIPIGGTVGIGSRDNGDGTSTVWFKDCNGVLIQQPSAPQVMWTGTGWNIPSVTLHPVCAIRGTDKVIANWSGPFVHMSAAALAAAGVKAVDTA